MTAEERRRDLDTRAAVDLLWEAVVDVQDQPTNGRLSHDRATALQVLGHAIDYLTGSFRGAHCVMITVLRRADARG